MGADRINRELLDGGFVDFIKPNATYQFSETDIDHDGKTYTMVFDMTDKFYASETLALEDLTILNTLGKNYIIYVIIQMLQKIKLYLMK